MPFHLNLSRELSQIMTLGGGEQPLVSTLLSIGSTVTSIYVIVLVFIFDKYQELEHKAAPRARVYFGSGVILILSFLLSGVGAVSLLMIKLRIISAPAVIPGYAIVASFIILVIGNLVIGTFVLFTDVSKWARRLQEWYKRRKRYADSSLVTVTPSRSTSLILFSTLTMVVGIGVLIRGYVIGVILTIVGLLLTISFIYHGGSRQILEQ